MKSRKSLLKRSRVYLILSDPGCRLSLKKIRALAAKEVGIIQLRDKISPKKTVLLKAIRLSKLLILTKALFIINDYADVAASSGADGVHLGQGDGSVRQARKILGKDKLIGVSCHTLKQAQKAQRDGADYIGIGPVFATPTKPGTRSIGLKEAARIKKMIGIPYFAIGGIGLDNLGRLKQSGIKRIAVCRAIMASSKPKIAAKQLYNKLIS